MRERATILMGTIERVADDTYAVVPRERLNARQRAWLDAEGKARRRLSLNAIEQGEDVGRH